MAEVDKELRYPSNGKLLVSGYIRIEFEKLNENLPDSIKHLCLSFVYDEYTLLSTIRESYKNRRSYQDIINSLNIKYHWSKYDINKGLEIYFKEEGLYKIQFDKTQLGFSVISDNCGKNAVICRVKDELLKDKLFIASIVYDINGLRMDDDQHEQILDTIITSKAKPPFSITFKKPKRNDFLFQHVQVYLDMS
eukprot:192412_1